MLCVIQFFIICATLVVQNSASPWERNNNIREFDLEWQCEQFCDRLKGTLTFNNSDSECTCTIATKDKLDFNSNHLEHKLNDLGFNFKIIDERNSNKVKRDTPADRIKKILAERRTQREEPEEHQREIVASGPNPVAEPEEQKDEKTIDRLHKLRAKLLTSKIEKSVISAPDNVIVGKAAPEEHKQEIVAQKKEDPKDKPNTLTSKIGHKNDNSNVGAPKDEPPKEDHNEPESSPKKLSALRAKLAASKTANHPPEVAKKAPEDETNLGSRRHMSPLHIRPRPILLPLGSKQEAKPEIEVPDKLQELRERIRMRLQSIRNKNLPNDDGHVPKSTHS